MRQRDAAEAATLRCRRGDVRRVGCELGPGVDDPARIAPDEPRVRPLQREGAGVVRAHERDVGGGERIHPGEATGAWTGGLSGACAISTPGQGSQRLGSCQDGPVAAAARPPQRARRRLPRPRDGSRAAARRLDAGASTERRRRSPRCVATSTRGSRGIPRFRRRVVAARARARRRSLDRRRGLRHRAARPHPAARGAGRGRGAARARPASSWPSRSIRHGRSGACSSSPACARRVRDRRSGPSRARRRPRGGRGGDAAARAAPAQGGDTRPARGWSPQRAPALAGSLASALSAGAPARPSAPERRSRAAGRRASCAASRAVRAERHRRSRRSPRSPRRPRRRHSSSRSRAARASPSRPRRSTRCAIAAARHGATLNDAAPRGVEPSPSATRCAAAASSHASIRALVPASTRTRDEGGAEHGNRIAFLALELPVGEHDLVRVLRTVRARSQARKRSGEAGATDALLRAADALPPAGRRQIARAAARAARFSVIVSNVPGPADRARAARAPAARGLARGPAARRPRADDRRALLRRVAQRRRLRRREGGAGRRAAGQGSRPGAARAAVARAPVRHAVASARPRAQGRPAVDGLAGRRAGTPARRATPT